MSRFLFTLFATLVVSEEELRFTQVYKQGYDTSCGVAVTASLLNTYWHITLAEEELYQDLILNQNPEGGEREYSVSLFAIAEYLKTQGIQSRAYQMDWETLEDSLAKGYAPILIHYENPDPHFALLLHLEADFGFVADPARGFVVVDKREFLKNYSGNVLLTASREATKDTEAIEQATREGRERLKRLQALARRGRFR
jgi:predicted double-glycine peptidase